MGLALHNSSDVLDLSQRHLHPGPSQVGRPRPRAHYNGAYYHADGSISLNRELAEHKLPLLDLVLLANHQKRTHRPRQTRRRQSPKTNQQWCIDEEAEGRSLALSSHKLPGEQRRRTPSLERQEAFRYPRTAMTRALSDQDARDISELYRLGLLYDDEHLRGAGFALDAISRPETEYTVRPAKQTRKSKFQEVPYDDDLQLALDLSLAELGRDESFAQYLCSPDLDEIPSDDESVYSARLEPLQFVSELMHSPDYFADNTPDLTTDSDSDRISFSCSSDDEAWASSCPEVSAGRKDDAVDNKASNAGMVLGDGS
ncbi:hypothetical protein EsH8_IV_001221 [Colletotrichum jinshuiense]